MQSHLETIVQEIKEIEDRQDKLDILIEYGESFTEVPETLFKRPFPAYNKVPACESDAYVFPVEKNGNLEFFFAVENPQGISAKALAVILAKGLNGRDKIEFSQIREEMAYDIFGKDLSMGKGAGLMSMIRMVKAFAEMHLKDK